MEKKQRNTFILFAFVWSFIFWGLSIFLVIKSDARLLENIEVLKSILNGTLGELNIATIFSTIAGYGPLAAVIFILIKFPDTRAYFAGKFKLNTPFKYFLQIIGLFVLISFVPAIPLIISNGLVENPSINIVSLVFIFFVYQFITAGTEEIGWRGYLLPSLLKEKNPWDASVYIGVVWALWHTPIVLYVFYSQSLPVLLIIISFAGFIAGTVAMSVVHTYYYMKTNNVLFSMFIHAISNTFPMFIGMMVANSYQVSVFVQILLWVFVIVLSKKNKELFDNMYTGVQK